MTNAGAEQGRNFSRSHLLSEQALRLKRDNLSYGAIAIQMEIAMVEAKNYVNLGLLAEEQAKQAEKITKDNLTQ